MKCADCKFWVALSRPAKSASGRVNDVLGECRKCAPAPRPVEGKDTLSDRDKGERSYFQVSWPATAQDAFCGDFAAKAVKQASFV